MTFPKTISVNYKNLHRGWVDVAFMSMKEAVEETKVIFSVRINNKDRTICTVRTGWNEANDLFIIFDGLLSTVHHDIIVDELRGGLKVTV